MNKNPWDDVMDRLLRLAVASYVSREASPFVRIFSGKSLDDPVCSAVAGLPRDDPHSAVFGQPANQLAPIPYDQLAGNYKFLSDEQLQAQNPDYNRPLCDCCTPAPDPSTGRFGACQCRGCRGWITAKMVAENPWGFPSEQLKEIFKVMA